MERAIVCSGRSARSMWASTRRIPMRKSLAALAAIMIATLGIAACSDADRGGVQGARKHTMNLGHRHAH